MPIDQELIKRRVQEMAAPRLFNAPKASQEQPTQIPVPTLRRIEPSQAELDYSTVVAQRPEQAAYAHPGKLARLAAILSGAGESLQSRPGGPELTGKLLARPYERATATWKGRMEALEPLAKMESERRASGIQMFGREGQLYNAQLDALTASEGQTAANIRAENAVRGRAQNVAATQAGKMEQVVKQIGARQENIVTQQDREDTRARLLRESQERIAKLPGRKRDFKPPAPPTAAQEAQEEGLELIHLDRTNAEYGPFFLRDDAGRPIGTISRAEVDKKFPNKVEDYLLLQSDLHKALQKRRGPSDTKARGFQVRNLEEKK
jgi:hypothetical protein